MQHLIVFFVSLFCILLELYLTRILSLKAWNHVVYVVIPFAMLGYGIGANLQMLFDQRKAGQSPQRFLGILLVLIGVLTFISVMLICPLPMNINDLLSVFSSLQSVGHLLVAYTLFMLPFVAIGYVVVYLFTEYPQESYRLYFFDLLGAGVGAFLFYPLINTLAVFPALFLVSMIGIVIGLSLIWIRFQRIILIVGLLLTGVGTFLLPKDHDPIRYAIDDRKGWECIPGAYPRNTFTELMSKWHPLGRTNLYRITDAKTRVQMASSAPVTFDINVQPFPEFSYFSTNFLSGTPVFHLTPEGMAETGSQINLFSVAIEAPYRLLKNPSVLVIGAGGGRDIFMANTHQAKQVLAAEINPGIFQAMSKGGVAYEYSGKVYENGPTTVFNIDGRYLVKKVSALSQDLIVLNGVDTFSGLSSGAYAYAESYLYTKDAVVDYLKALQPDGMINFNRWLFMDMPRETLRLQAIALEALRESGIKEPWNHIVIGAYRNWSIMLIKKSAFTTEQTNELATYFDAHNAMLIYPSRNNPKVVDTALQNFEEYAKYFRVNKEKFFAAAYPYDISVVTDENPFFYKYYKLSQFSPFNAFMNHHDGTVIFLTQFMILGQALFFILLFIFLPLFVLRRRALTALPRESAAAFITYFSCLGIGFMFLEIALMQQFVLLLASPIYSISVVLAALLVSTGAGSYFTERFRKYFATTATMITVLGLAAFIYIIALIAIKPMFSAYFLHMPFLVRALAIGAFLFPLGMMLGIFFPTGLELISKKYSVNIPWAWGINSGFSVLGGILSIVIGQFMGFNAILMLGACFYLIAILTYRKLSEALSD